ncbi:GSCFA domain-containing protein [Chitinimonas koreensis]|uniref:GSCFA domain-containing protein n=1 Tax=Chitinimonas koreensis TaxID=356302 RepID=UPI0003F9014C|nr:GSCFA domain-containing protein [Chitinimonas koreensis]QNM95085.1 GSCFA domain-containing protein [Chitinimonas koreensis]QPB41103.1 GSCFA domain-containing protein [Chitinimonas sp.]
MNPYQDLPPRAFWRTAVADKDMLAIDELWTPKFALAADDAIVTAGSCFARHIGRALAERGMRWLDAEPAPAGLGEAEREAGHYGVFSFRSGNIYTAAMLRQWLAWAYGHAAPPAGTWCEGGRHYDPFRPAIEPAGYDSAEALLAAREATLQAIRRAVAEARCFVFTLGLTEAWLERDGSVVYPVCPGTVHGEFDAARHLFHNYAFAEIHRDLSAAIDLLRAANPQIRVLLTVSPVPLTATASGQHALVATSHSKSVLRAVAGQLAQERAEVDYFPSYEIITAHPFKGAFFEPNLRSVAPHGVAFVMRQFFAGLERQPAAPPPAPAARPPRKTFAGEDFFCEDAVLDYYNPR